MNTVLLLLTLALAVTVKAHQTCKDKLQNDCTKEYNDRWTQEMSPKALCVSLAIYWKCVKDTKKTTQSCQSNLYYHTLAILIPKILRENNCGNVSIDNLSAPVPITRPTTKPECEISRRKTDFNKISTRHCGLFGDPHLRTFDDNKQTCVVQGAWPLLDNQYLAVQVTNVYLLPGLSDATATSKITVVIKGRKGCSKQRTYRAVAYSLPAAFIDGSREAGPKDCPTKVSEVIKGSLIHIDICNIATKIIIRQVGHYLTFHVRMPQEIVENTTTGLCVSGCPPRERIDYRELLSNTDEELITMLPGRTRITRREATKKCTDSNVNGFYLDSCLFDLLTTGDANFSAAAKSAMDDAVSLDPLGTLRDLQTYKLTVPRNRTDSRDRKGVIRQDKNNTSRMHFTLFLLISPFILVFTSSL